MMVSLMEEVLRSGTGAGVRSRGFTLPAAGKTGTSHDGWFAGFTSKLICVVWVGFDDNKELRLEGAQSALPIWTEFMKRAHQFREYRGVRAFSAPDGVVSVEVDPATGDWLHPLAPARGQRCSSPLRSRWRYAICTARDAPVRRWWPVGMPARPFRRPMLAPRPALQPPPTPSRLRVPAGR
jgi:membrane peptidoglycan carboxypeptidase